MPLTYLIDEHLRGAFLEALFAEGLAEGFALSVLQVGDENAPPLETKDPLLIAWCQAHNRVLISRDKKTLPDHLSWYLASGGSSPGIFIIRSAAEWSDVLQDLVLRSQASFDDEYRDQIVYIPS